MTSFADRQKAAAEAKQAVLAKFKPKPTVADPNFQSRQQRKALELEAVRIERAAAKEAARLEAEKAKQAQVEAALNNEEAALDAKRSERKARKAAAKAEARTKREMRQQDRARA
jgi:hypothetical protein